MGFEGVDGWGLDEERYRGCRGVHAAYEHAGDLGGYLVVGDAVAYFVGRVRRDEVEEVVIYAVEVFAVLPGVV